MKNLKKFQFNAKEKLVKRSAEVLQEEDGENNLIVFKSPTGSGKTFTMTKYMEDMTEWSRKEDVDKEIVFLWVSIGKGDLEEQSYNSISANLEEETNVYKIEEIFNKDYLNHGDVVVFNWENIRSRDKENKWTNIVMKEGDVGNFVECLKKTRDNGTKIVLIIDESHVSAGTQRAEELKAEVINADLTIEVSATPILSGHIVSVNSEDVIKEGVIKNEILINDGIDNGDSEKILLNSAFNKMEELKKLYKEEGLEVNPLCLIQLPNSKEGDKKREVVEIFLNKKNINIENEKLAVHLTEEKSNNEREILCENDNKVEYLIFKQAIDTGWDCPRAQILIRFRDGGDTVFNLQTVGRILRMPEQKHYNNQMLNKSYVYTNDEGYKIEVTSGDGENIIKELSGKRKEKYIPIKIQSYYQHRTDFGDIEADFYDLSLKDIFCKVLGKNTIELRKNKIDLSNVTEKIDIMKFKNISTNYLDELAEENKFIKGKIEKSVNLSENDRDLLFNILIKNNLHNFAPVRSLATVRTAIRRYFIDCIDIDPKKTGLIYIQNIILKNQNKFNDALDESVLDYIVKKAEKNKKAEEDSGEIYEWDVPLEYFLNPHSKESHNFKKFIISGNDIARYDSKIEKDFLTCLDVKEDVEWWYKNGSEHKKENFGIKYNKEDGSVHTFQPDFIVRYKDGSVGIYDTKPIGDRVDDTKIKSEALQIYLKKEKKQKLKGGIIVKNKNDKFYLNLKDEYVDYSIKKSDWELF